MLEYLYGKRDGSKIGIFEPNPLPYKYPNILYPVILRTYPPMKMEQIESSETLAYKSQTQGNYPKESTYNHNCTDAGAQMSVTIWSARIIRA